MGNKKTEHTDSQNYFAAKMAALASAIKSSDHKELKLNLVRNKFNPEESFCFIFTDSYDALFELPDITKTDLGVFSKLTKIMDYGNEVPQMTQQQLAELLGMARPNLTRSLKTLVKHGVVIKHGKKLTVNPRYCYKGDLRERDKALKALKALEAQKRKENPEPINMPNALPVDQFKWLEELVKDNTKPKDSPADDENDVPF